jgi:hypothetical protein
VVLVRLALALSLLGGVSRVNERTAAVNVALRRGIIHIE